MYGNANNFNPYQQNSQGAQSQNLYYPGPGGQPQGSPYGGMVEMVANPTYRRNDMNAGQNRGRDGMQMGHNEDLDSYKDYGRSDQEKGTLYDESRNGFIKKVYTLLSLQLLVTVAVCFWAMNSQSFSHIFVNAPMMIIVSVLLIGMSCIIGCCIDVVRKYGLPILIVFTLLFSILVGIICTSTNPTIVLTAAGITAVIVIGLTIFACVTKSDFTGCGPYLFVISLMLFVFGIALIFWKNPIAHLVYSCLTGLLFCIYLVFDTQMVLGKGAYAYTLDDAYFAAIQLYIDIIEIFIQILRILSFIENR